MRQQEEAALLAAWRLMDDGERDFYLDVFRYLVRGRPVRQRPILSIVASDEKRQ